MRESFQLARSRTWGGLTGCLRSRATIPIGGYAQHEFVNRTNGRVVDCLAFLSWPAYFVRLFSLVGKRFCAFAEDCEIASIPEYATSTLSGDFLDNSQPFEIG